MKQYHYFVSYQYSKAKDQGFGQVNLLLAKSINEPKDIEGVQNYIKENNKFKNVVILNILLLKSEDTDTP